MVTSVWGVIIAFVAGCHGYFCMGVIMACVL